MDLYQKSLERFSSISVDEMSEFGSCDKLTDAITVENLSKTFGTLKAVDNISFRVKKGTVFGFLGPNGAGKSTAIKMLTCQLSPTSGNGYVCGFEISKNCSEIKKRIGVSSPN